MIYNIEIPDTLEQGDICQNLPKITPNQINFDEIKDQWQIVIKKIEKGDIPDQIFKLKVNPLATNGVILSQSCDIRPGFSILFAELKKIPENIFSSNINKRINSIKKIIRDETRYHYFPACNKVELFEKPMLLDFKSLFLIPIEFLNENIKEFFVARLKPIARNVLCEKISRFFTRYAFEDIMFLNNEERTIYLESIAKEDRKAAEETLKKLSIN